jgi:hypothetical protein
MLGFRSLFWVFKCNGLTRRGLEALVLDATWSTPPEGSWISGRALKEATGTDDVTFTRVINFLTSWDFIEAKTSPELQLQRKQEQSTPSKRRSSFGKSPPTALPRFFPVVVESLNASPAGYAEAKA